MESLIEQQRRCHEERERVMDAMVGEKLLLNPLPPRQNVLSTEETDKQREMSVKLGHKQRLYSQHRLKNLTKRFADTTERLISIYKDSDGARQEEISSLSGLVFGDGQSGVNVELREFYSRLKVVKEYHRKHPDASIAMPISAEFDRLNCVRSAIRREAVAATDGKKSVAAASVAAATAAATVSAKAVNDDATLLMEATRDVQVRFSDVEKHGRYLDLHECHASYLNLKAVRANLVKLLMNVASPRVDYLTYVAQFDSLLAAYPSQLKLNADYATHVHLLVSYLRSFVNRVMPLLNLGRLIDRPDGEFAQEFNRKWGEGKFNGWSLEVLAKGNSNAKKLLADTQTNESNAAAHFIDLSPYASAADLTSLGAVRLKQALSAMGLKCGGTVEQRASRLFATKGLRTDQIDKSMFASSSSDTSAVSTVDPKLEAKIRSLVLAEAHITFLAEMLSPQRKATRDNVERKLASASRAHNAGDSDDDGFNSDDDDADDDLDAFERELDNKTNGNVDDDDIPYNPKNIPLGWDGKPIPYWLYKLHGLNITFTCEICGNATYKGPKAFQKHFSEWRHAHGMRCLGIPNTAHFASVTSIEDALVLWDKIKASKDAECWHADQDEEYEDSQGHVLTKQTYEDLRRQGVL